MILLFLLHKAYRARPRLTVNAVLTYIGVFGVFATFGGVGRLFIRFYGPEYLRTPWIEDPGPGVDAAAFMAGLVVVVLVAAALLELADRQIDRVRGAHEHDQGHAAKAVR